ncbi:ParB/RepB/Spo0J family partition protein [Streptomyces humi]|uniref:ParB/RepB/Spo0J family partition protein n=1 Tax=Streptomyces humi TaxID=1428620 RepID=UPI0006288234|nr:ParB/RepB/Spo0J family partition protein [Streptomyces humi]
MSKADQLGAGRFGGGARPVSARRTAIGAATGVPTEGVAPPTRLPVKRISPNPENPRTSMGDLTELAGSLAEHGQKAAITVMNRDAYIKANPDRAGDLEPDTTHVVVDGSSRLAAAREAGLTHLNVMVDDEQGSDGDAILESALVANIHRNDLDPLDEARALQRLLAIHGSQVKLAKRLRKSQGWVSQRLALLNLTPELQAAVGEEPVELLRSVAKLPHDRQEEALQELKTERAGREAERRAPVPAPVTHEPPPQDSVPHEAAPQEAAPEEPASREPVLSRSLTEALESEQPSASVPPPVSPPEVSVPATRAPQRATAAGASSPSAAETEAPERAESAAPDPQARGGRQLPYDDGWYIAMHLIKKMSDTEFDKMLSLLNKHQSERLGSQPTS